ncbi:NAD(P)-dependent dehydrogenase, short-chain alcohol dehydrogenase family [Halobacillus dabanensis]|uniref:NAD(P)-dependent dehydrogenase, short-chain alcohol dehydrogenase family n=1 Tax=Halobacillus dabanensis TaxID=240302 RepID=A0A1I4AFC7_HALDA|nr:3-hydroxyacyl-CoA dehydrogenase [Halobacillus dabanensis]SFK55165.1 NAD(P)-dependent dehydrogenase, short-chain alcohol dehydrogenase family [Halobacillus dabanensis]
MELEEVVAVVTGGASGLGEATVRKIVRNGGRAAIVDQNDRKGEELAQEIGPSAIFVKTDVTSEEEINRMLDVCLATFGKVNTVVNCAGIVIGEKVVGREGPHHLESFSKVIEVNLIGTFNVIRLAASKMQENDVNEYGERGVIINTASIAAFDGQIGQAAYSASKGGVAGMTLPISRELARHGVRVMAIAPGLFETPMFEQLPEEARDALGKMTPFPQRLGKPYEFAKLALSIIDNPMLNGEVIRLDGAIRMQPK